MKAGGERPARKRRFWGRVLAAIVTLALVALVVGAVAATAAYMHFSAGLPDHRMLESYEPPVATRVYAGDGSLMAQFASENRVFVPLEAIPERVRQAFLSAEDQHFFSHYGIDPLGIVRAMIANVEAVAEGRRLQGASTITQQVAKNFLLSNELSYRRKIREVILAFRIERTLSKERILELYLNEIYLGFGSYGVAAAALNYFNKSLDDLSIAEAAFLAALPKAPNNYHPEYRRTAAIERRNWVIARLAEEGFVTAREAAIAQREPLVTDRSGSGRSVAAAYAIEEIRRAIAERYGTRALYEGGLYVRSTIDPVLQDTARRVLRSGLGLYDRRHGWRGPIGGIELVESWADVLADLAGPTDVDPWQIAVVLGMNDEAAIVGFAGGSHGLVLLEDMAWARKRLENGRLGPVPARPSDVLANGDVILVEYLEPETEPDATPVTRLYALRQIPQVSGGLVAMDPHTGRVLAMQGGFSFSRSEFNRVTQAWRQPGSAFKPFVYMAALDHGYTPAALIEDAPFVLDPGAGQEIWRPSNYSEEYYGLVPLRVGIEKSRNLMTVRLANTLGPQVVEDYIRKFGILEKAQPYYLAVALGSAETTLLRLTAAYAAIVNGGRRIEPDLVERIQDRNGLTVWRRDRRGCGDCRVAHWDRNLEVPRLPDERERLVDRVTAYQMVHIMEGVVERGTGVQLRDLRRPLAGKTGTTNENRDAWFLGFSPDLVVGVYVGFDRPATLGNRETGSSVAIPVWKLFMAEALADDPVIPFRIPPGVRLVRIDADHGLLPGELTTRIITEAFRPGSEPTVEADSHAVIPQGGAGSRLSGVY